ncbi:MAG: hypothetical protein IH841_03885 [Thaumarchaeota archaeon]|nr:hypothetical protein [Nitrososphaerota archaeon]
MDSETFGIEKGFGQKVISWINEQAKKNKSKFEARLYDYDITTKNFGTFEMFSWIGDIQVIRNLVVKASKRFKVKIIEGGYTPKERTFTMKKSDYAIVRKGDKVLGHLEFESSRFGFEKWKIKDEERR